MRFHVETFWYNLEGDGFHAADFVDADNEDEVCELFEARCVPERSEVTGVFTIAEAFY